MRKWLPQEQRDNLAHKGMLALSYVGHAYSMLVGVARCFLDLALRCQKSFSATIVDAVGNRFVCGLRALGEYVLQNKGILFVWLLCVERSLYMILYMGVGQPSLVAYCYIFFSSILMPVLLTPQLFVQPVRAVGRAFKYVFGGERQRLHG